MNEVRDSSPALNTPIL